MLEKKILDPKIIRKHILTMAYTGQSAHVACAFSIVDILCSLFQVMNFDPSDPNRDFLILSKGHGVMALYACLFELGLLPKEDLDRYFKDGSRLHGLAEPGLPGIEFATGSLGHGLPIAVGIAYGLKQKRSAQMVYCIVGDGEMQEGSCWEAIQFAAHHKLNNLTLIVDNNEFQAMGKTKEILGGRLHERLHAFGFAARSVYGPDAKELKRNLRLGHAGCPIAIVAFTAKGHGVTFMENDNAWHYKRLSAEAYHDAMLEQE